jgi:hypothetical protein
MLIVALLTFTKTPLKICVNKESTSARVNTELKLLSFLLQLALNKSRWHCCDKGFVVKEDCLNVQRKINHPTCHNRRSCKIFLVLGCMSLILNKINCNQNHSGKDGRNPARKPWMQAYNSGNPKWKSMILTSLSFRPQVVDKRVSSALQ